MVELLRKRLMLLLVLWFAARSASAQADTTKARPLILLPDKKTEQVEKMLRFKLDETSQEQKDEFEKLELWQKAGKAIPDQLLPQFQELKNQHLQIEAVAKSIIESPEERAPFRKDRIAGPSQFDSRIELRQLNPLITWQQNILQNARSVGLVIKKENLAMVTDSIYKISMGITLGQKYSLCPGQAFADQPIAGEGTAFLINGEEIMTAAHVLSEPIQNYALVFGFEVINKVGAYEALIPVENIYYLNQITFRDEALDVAIARLDRSADRKALSLSPKAALTPGTEVYMIGYPSGLPQKVALNASIHATGYLQYFFTSLDAFQGNSGSPVFRLDTHEIIGILVSGELDYAWNGSCNVPVMCKVPYCQGEKAIRISEVERLRSDGL